MDIRCKKCFVTSQYDPDELPVSPGDRFWMTFWKGTFVFGLTIMLFTLSLVYMNHSFDLVRLDRLLAEPSMKVEHATYSNTNGSAPPDVIRYTREPKAAEVKDPPKPNPKGQ